jgi:hypothetical protein
MVARMAMRRDTPESQPLTGIGDEARGGPGWVATRRGDEVLLLRLGRSVRDTPPANLAHLAYTAVSRLPSSVAPSS